MIPIYVLNVVEHDVYKYLFLNVKENEISVYLNCKKVNIFLSVKYYILKSLWVVINSTRENQWSAYSLNKM
jgi:hypothetical protein